MVPTKKDRMISYTWICDCLVLGKSSKHILQNGDLMLIYYGRIRKNHLKQVTNPRKKASEGSGKKNSPCIKRKTLLEK